tara:strand:- start:1768 stop:1998 length:231 start_codon:yes stop_codon:yes gene_type:complete
VEDSAITAGFVAMSMALVKIVEKAFAKTGNASLECRLGALETQMARMQDGIDQTQKAFFEFREMARIKWARDEKND